MAFRVLPINSCSVIIEICGPPHRFRNNWKIGRKNSDQFTVYFSAQHQSFQSRHLPIILRLQTGHKIHLFRASGAQWRRQRHVLNPTFSAAKLKLMSPLVDGCIESMLKKLDETLAENSTEINIYNLYKRMTMDVICRCAFGIDTDMQNDTENIYMRKSAGVFELDIDRLSIVKLTNLFPCFENPFRHFYLGQVAIRRFLIRLFPVLGQYIEETPGSWLINRLRDVVDFRHTTMSQTGKRLDLLQLMIDASTRDEVQVGRKTFELFCQDTKKKEMKTHFYSFFFIMFQDERL